MIIYVGILTLHKTRGAEKHARLVSAFHQIFKTLCHCFSALRVVFVCPSSLGPLQEAWELRVLHCILAVPKTALICGQTVERGER